MANSLTASLKTVTRNALGTQAVDQLRELIIEGILEPGSPLVERELAQTLGVSRTPVRESLMQLQREGLVKALPTRGMIVSPLLISDVREIFPLLASLERFALNTLDSVDAATLAKLEEVNALMAVHKDDAIRMTDLDSQWHTTLLDAVHNRQVHGFMSILRQQARRYEIPHMTILGRVERSMAEHAEVIGMLRNGTIEDAARRLERHWLDGVEPLVESMNQSEAAPEG